MTDRSPAPASTDLILGARPAAGGAAAVSALDRELYGELESLARYIQHAKQEIAAIRPGAITGNDIRSATDELDAVIGDTEAATHRIMDNCDAISAISAGLGEEPRAALNGAVTGIFEACNFQDITGQRITKVVRTLKHIESKVESLIRVLGEEVGRGGSAGTPAPADAADPHDERTLLNGPQLPGAAIDQSAVDRLLGFD